MSQVRHLLLILWHRVHYSATTNETVHPQDEISCSTVFIMHLLTTI